MFSRIKKNTLDRTRALADVHRQQIRQLKEVYSGMPSGPVVMETGAWNEIPLSHVYTTVCAFDEKLPNATCVNVEFRKGGYLEPHIHETSDETIFCVHGEYRDEVNNVTLKTGETQFIPMGQLHSGRSDGCLLIVTWEPPLPVELESE